MNYFLNEIAKKLFEKHQHEFSDILIVVPTRRACMYMKHFLAQLSGKALFCPELMPLEEFMHKLADVDILDTTKLLFELYEVYKEFDTKNSSFEDFTPIGMAILSDLNSIDRSMSDPEPIFDYLLETAAFQRWNIDQEFLNKSNSVIGDYFEFWRIIQKSHQILKNRLLAKRKAFSGLAYRLAANFCGEKVGELGFSHIAFVGLSQLWQAEEEVISTLIRAQKASCYWDTDSFYVDMPMHEAGYFFRHYLFGENGKKGWAKKDDFEQVSFLGEGEKNIYIIAAPNAVTQAKVAGQIVKNSILSEKDSTIYSKKLNHLGIFLPDEGLLIPILHSLPEKVEEVKVGDMVNVTMGIALRDTPLFSLIQYVFDYQENIRLMPDKMLGGYYKDVRKILQHPYLKDLKYEKNNPLERVRKENLIYLPLADLFEYEENGMAYTIFFDFWDNNTEKAIQALKGIVSFLATYFAEKGNRFNLDSEYLFEFHTLICRIEKSIKDTGTRMTLPTFVSLLTEMMQDKQIPFTGEPLKPIQVMGMLESRALDFEKVVVLSCNEGMLPKGKNFQSLLPYEVRSRFGIPTHYQQDAAIAYTFYRLFHRSKDIYLVYATDSETGKSGEKSRFLYQIEQEFKQFKNVKVQHLLANIALPDKPEAALRIKKTKKTVLKTLNYLRNPKKGMTASTITAYLQNPYQFFLHKIFNVGQNVTVEEDIETGTFGKLIHLTLEKLFENLVGKEVKREDIVRLADNVDFIKSTIQANLETEAGAILQDKGKNYLLKEVAFELINQYLQKIEKNPPFKIIAQEIELRVKFPISFQNRTFYINLWGRIDRIELNAENEFEIVDFKTGKINTLDIRITEKQKSKIGNMDLYYNFEKMKLMQLMIYKYLLLKNTDALAHLNLDVTPEFSNVKSGYWSFRNIDEGFLPFENHNFGDEKSFVSFIEDFIKNIVLDMLNSGKPITEKADVLNVA